MSSEKNLKDKKKRKKDNYLLYDFVKVTGALPALCWLRPKKYYPFGKPNLKGAVLISANHRSLVDPITLLVSFPTRRLNCLATKDLYSSKFMETFFNKMHCIKVDKDNFSMASFHQVVERLKEGRAVAIFPEGQVNTTGGDSLLTFKSGAVLMAHKSGAPLLPVYIAERKKWYQRQRIVVGERIDIKSLVGKIPTIEELNKASELLRDKEIELREYYESIMSKKKNKNKKQKEIKEEVTKK